MKLGTPVNVNDCPSRIWTRCRCIPVCAICGHKKHTGIHGGVVAKPGYVFGHEYEPKQTPPDISGERR